MSSLFLLLFFSFADYNQSVQMFQQPGFYEMNPVLGYHPSGGQMALFGAAGCAASLAADALISPEISPGSHIVLDSIATSERYNVEDNELLRQNFKGNHRTRPFIIAVTIHF